MQLQGKRTHYVFQYEVSNVVEIGSFIIFISIFLSLFLYSMTFAALAFGCYNLLRTGARVLCILKCAIKKPKSQLQQKWTLVQRLETQEQETQCKCNLI